MGSIRLNVGTEWLLDGRAFRIVRQLTSDRFVALDLKFNTEQTLTAPEILSLYAQGSLTFATPEVTTEKEAVTGTKPTVFGDLPAAVRRIVELRWHAIEPFAQLAATANRRRIASPHRRTCSPRRTAVPAIVAPLTGRHGFERAATAWPWPLPCLAADVEAACVEAVFSHGIRPCENWWMRQSPKSF